MEMDNLLVESFIKKYPYQAAMALEGFPDMEVAEFIQHLPKASALSLLNNMNKYKAGKYVALLPLELGKELIERSDLALAESLLRQFDESFATKMLAVISPDLSEPLKLKLEQNPNTVGMFMLPVMTTDIEMTVKEALQLVRKNRKGIASYLYIVDANGIFGGGLRSEVLLFAKPSKSLVSLVDTAMPKFYADMPLSSTIDHPKWYEYTFIPVVDRSEKLLGALPFERTREVIVRKEGQLTKDVIQTSMALGELYRIGLTGFLQSVGK